MKRLLKYFELPYKLMDDLTGIASLSSCHRSQCGSIIYSEEGKKIGRGWNSHPCDTPGKCFKDSVPRDFKSDRNCCVHAEQRAIIDALCRMDGFFNLRGSTLFFLRLDDEGKPKRSGQPYCTICSKMALEAGVKEFCLWHEEGWTAYETSYYNEISFQYREGV